MEAINLKKAGPKGSRFELLDLFLLVFLTVHALIILIPFYNVIMVSLVSQKEYMEKMLVLLPSAPSLKSYAALFEDGRIWIGYRTTLLIILLGLPLNLFLTSSLAYGLSRNRYPGRRMFFMMILFTMIFNGGIIPLYLVVKELGLTNTIWSVVFTYGVNTFYMIIMMNYYNTLPDSLMESARLDGAGEWTILFRIVLPLSMPILATITLFYAVDRWNEWFTAMIFIRKTNIVPLQLVLRNIVIDSQVLQNLQSGGTVATEELKFSMGMKMAAVIVTVIPVMCVFPFLQKHFVKGVLVGAIKA